MQVDQVSSYLSQLMHTQDTTATAVESSQNSDSSVTKTGNTVFEQLYKEYVSTDTDSTSVGITSYEDLMGLLGGSGTSTTVSDSVTEDDNRTPLQVAQDAYAEFLSLASDAVSGSSGSSEDDILNDDTSTSDSLSDLSDAISSLSTILEKSSN